MSNLQGWDENFSVFWYELVWIACIRWSKQFKQWELSAVAVYIMVAGALTCRASLHSLCDLKVAQMKVSGSLNREFMFYRFEHDPNATEAIKNICCVKGEGAVDHSTLTGRVEEISFGLQEPQRSGMFKLALNREFRWHDFGKRIRCCRIVPHVIKILQSCCLVHVAVNFFLTSQWVLYTRFFSQNLSSKVSGGINTNNSANKLKWN